MSIITVQRLATPDEITAEMDRRGTVIEKLETDLRHWREECGKLHSRIDRSDAVLKDVRPLLVRCHDRIHALPRTSDTELAASIERLLGRISSDARDGEAV